MIRIAITSENTATVSPDTADAAHLEAKGGTDIQQRIIDYVTTIARRDGNDVKVHIDADQPIELVVSPHGEVSEAQPPGAPKPEEPSPADADNIPASPEVELPATEEPEESTHEQLSHDAPQDTHQTEYPSRRALRDTTFLVTETRSAPATKGWRGALNKLGMRLDPSVDEQSERDDIQTVSQHWPGPRTIAVVNRKGGANKTPTVALLSAVLARYGGGPVVAWDNNESQGTLGWRTEQGAHDSSVLHLVAAADKLLAPAANSADLAHYVHHQTADKFDVLRSDENEEGDHEVTAEEVDTAHRVLSKFYRLLVMDSGNTARSANWRRMIHHTTQLVVPVTAMEDRAEAARLTLQTLESRGGHDAELANNAVVIVSEATDAARGSGDAMKRSREEATRIAEGFKPLVRDVIRVPYDPALVNGVIQYDALRPETQRAWLAAAAAVAKGF
jgi:MinD-like ATPase involved in chromosome partitioning or flagellar assembly